MYVGACREILPRNFVTRSGRRQERKRERERQRESLSEVFGREWYTRDAAAALDLISKFLRPFPIFLQGAARGRGKGDLIT